MLPQAHQIAFVVFAVVTGLIGLRGFYGVYQRVRAGRPDSEPRFNHLARRAWYALTMTLLQRRTFRRRPVVSTLHAFIFYGFVFYLLVNLVDGAEGFARFTVRSTSAWSAAYNLAADLLSALVLVGVVALAVRRFAAPARRDFLFNEKTLLHERVRRGKISRDSLIVSCFILFHVGSRAIGAGAKMAVEGPDRFQPFATLLSHAFTPENAEAWRIFGYWGALGSVLVFLSYFPYSKHIHLFAAPVKYLTAREARSGELPAMDGDLEAAVAEGGESLGAKRLEDLAWPRLLDAYACIQCNRCQDVCPAAVTGKALSPAALEINKRMELNALAGTRFGAGEESPRPLLAMALSAEAAWACTTCGACMQACPVENEQMLDIIDVRRRQVMVEGEFPVQLQSAFRGMERAGNPWGINHEQRMAWAEGLRVPTVDDEPEAEVLYWVGCAPSYDPQSQKTARALVQLLQRAGVRFAVLGKKECCTGDSARRAGNEYLYQQLAKQNIQTLNAVRPKTIVTTCPHCMNTIANEYRQLGGTYTVVHHTELLARLVAEGRLEAEQSAASVTYHDPCYLGRHNGVYDAPRNVLRVLSNDFVELPRRCENSFCCGAGGAQFWKEEEPGPEKVPANRFREVEQTLEGRRGNKVLAVGCPFCKTMLSATPEKAEASIEIRDIAELLLEGVLKKAGMPLHGTEPQTAQAVITLETQAAAVANVSKPPELPTQLAQVTSAQGTDTVQTEPQRKKWQPMHAAAGEVQETAAPPGPVRNKWTPKQNK